VHIECEMHRACRSVNVKWFDCFARCEHKWEDEIKIDLGKRCARVGKDTAVRLADMKYRYVQDR
jgi:hypothetical protein